jgi:DNA polymerase-3 subunit alpha
MSDNFVHLHAHTSIGSMQDAMTSVNDMFKRAKEMGQPAIALTDHGTMAAVFDARKASKKHGVKYIPGCETYFVNDINNKKEKRRHLILLAKNEIGYRNLLKLNYEGFMNFQYVPFLRKVFPRIDWKLLEQYHEGIICLTACGSGPLARTILEYDESGECDKEECYISALKIASRLKSIFGNDLYLEMQPHDLKVFKHVRKTGEVEKDAHGEPIVVLDQQYLNQKLVQISGELDISLVATCDVHYLDKEDAEIHDMLMAINEKKSLSDTTRHRYEVEEFYMKNGGEVINYFTEKFNRKLAIEICNNTVEIANQCEDSSYIDSSEIRFPKFDAKSEDDYPEFLKWKKEQKSNGIPEDQAFMRFRCVKAFKKKYGHLKGEKKKEYKQRMVEEIKVLEFHNFSSYMLITSDSIIKAKEHGIRVGPGRGSVGGCFVGNLLGIHEVDPMQYGLLFERFHNREKTSYPDIDSDLSPAGRVWAVKYITEKYGKYQVAHVSNLSTMTPKVVIKDVARSLELGGGRSEAFKIANAITDSIPAEAKTFDDALQMSKKFRDFCAEYPDLEKFGRKLVGLEKTFSTHAAGIVISDIDLSTYVPLRCDKDGTVSVQYEKNRCESVGLIKMDFLGLEHLKVLDSTIENARALGMECPDTDDLAPFDDQGVWDMLSSGKAVCVFQMGSPHMRALCKRIRPQNIEDLSLVNALGRPSAGESKTGRPTPRDTYIARRDGKQKVTFKHQCIKDALENTLGICVYEEQLAKLAKFAAGWDLNKADGLRKFTKLKGKNPTLAAKVQEDFINDTVKFSKLSKKDATAIWEEIIEPFSGYGFNKAHGIFYSLNGYHTAYYKHHFPAPFMAAVLRSEIEKPSSNEEKIKLYKKEAARMGIAIKAPDINKSGEFFTVLDEKTIAMGLAAVKGVGVKAVQNIIETRNEHPFVSFSDFLYRTNSRVVQKSVIQALAKAGCLDSFGITRKSAFDNYANVRTKANKYIEKVATSGVDPWNLMLEWEWTEREKKILGNEEWNKKEILEAEGETLGDYISGDINDLYGGFFSKKGTPLKKLKKLAEGTPIRVEVIVENISTQRTKSGKNKGNAYGSCTVMDQNKDSVTMKVWSNSWKHVKDQLKIGRPIRALCRVNVYKGNHMLVLSTLEQVG